ncbi:HAD-IC family P-type ATPase [Ectobacillus polymachus]|uniref:cation-translocating P-type ATPase n=1 Tax=Ectobacillus polymachus TaxID=1508806 RepID=UPI003A851EC4
MQDILHKPYSQLPGRIRTEIYGLRDHSYVKEKFETIFSSIEGVILATASTITGNILLIYDESQISVDILNLFLHKFEEVLFRKFEKEHVAISEIAAGTRDDGTPTVPLGNEPSFSKIKNLLYMPTQTPNGNSMSSEDEKVPFPLVLSVGGLGILGIKQLLFGRSSLARHPVPFYLSGLLAISTGYPFIKRGLANIQKKKGINIDFILGAGALSLALVRENLVVLAGLSMLQYLNWKRQKKEEDILEPNYISTEMQQYSQTMSVAGVGAAAVSLALSLNPITAFSVLLAANPRPITLSTEYTWKQAEYIAREEKLDVPLNGSFHQLSHVKTIVFDDADMLIENGRIRSEYAVCFEQLRNEEMQISVLHNKKQINLEKLQERLHKDYNLPMVDVTRAFPKQREDVLFVFDQALNRSDNIISYYPSIPSSQFASICKNLSLAKALNKKVQRNFRVTKIWNTVGAVMAASLARNAPLIPLVGDALNLVFMSRSNRWIDKKMRREKQSSKQIATEEKSERSAWHTMEGDQVVSLFQSDIVHGLSSHAIDTAFQKYGKNELISKPRPHWIYGYLSQFKEFTTIILGSTALLSILSGHLIDGIIMGTILLFNAGVGTIQERKAEQAVETLTKFVPPDCHVIRDGKEQQIPASDLLPGDIILLEAGDRVPADIRLLENWNVEVNESALTGESLPVKKEAEKVEEHTGLADRRNLLYLGTHITRGKLKGIVVETGSRTEMGHLLTMLSEEEIEDTPLQKQVTAISKTFMKVALVAGSFVFLAGLLRGMPLGQLGITSVALVSSAIPEGLPVTITIALTAGILRMAKKNTVIRKLSSLETLGRVTVVCSDKTGTLTKNEMTVKKIATVRSIYDVSGNGYIPEGKICDCNGEDVECEELNQLLMIGMLCNNSKLDKQEDGWEMVGDPTEGAILTLAGKRAKWVQDHTRWKRIYEVPFDSKDRKMSVVCTEDKNNKEDCYLMTKGSIEKILEKCTTYQQNGKAYLLTEEIKNEILKQNDEFADQALRVLAFAYRPLMERPKDGCLDDIDQDLIYVGMVGMMDPPKDDVQKSVEESIALGIKPIMITGDHPKTALAIAKNIGIWNESQKIVTGNELDELSEEELRKEINNIAIFARVTPEHKLKIITTLQQAGHIVAMTGDGVNDSPAIKRADVGIAMGVSGTQVTKESADMILQNDGFSSIIEGVKEGRTIIGNIRKALGCLLSGNLAEIVVTSTAVIAGLPLPIIPVQILLMNLLTDALPAMVLAINPGNKALQTKRQGIADKELYSQVITRGILLGAGSVGLFVASLAAGLPLGVAQTTAFAALVAGQLVQTFSWRQENSAESIKDWSKDKFLLGALGVSWAAMLAAIYVPMFAGVFQTTALPLAAWVPILAVAGGSALIVKPLTKIWSNQKGLENPIGLAAA